MNYEEILQDLAGETTTTFWSGKGIKTPEVYRLENQSNRFYYTSDLEIGTSVTTWLKRVTPTPYFLMDWYKTKGEDYVNEKLHLSSNYGTCCHIAMSLLMKFGEIDLSKMGELTQLYWDIHDIQEGRLIEELRTREEWTQRLQNDMICLLSFIQEKNFECHAIEWIGFHKATKDIPVNYGCAIDLIGEMDWRGGRKTAIVDWKTGNLYQDQGYQLLGNLAAWKQHNEMEIDYMFNLLPKNASNKSKYDLKERKIDDYKDRFYLYAKLAGLENFNAKPIPNYGMINKETDINSMMIDPYDYIKQKMENQ